MKLGANVFGSPHPVTWNDDDGVASGPENGADHGAKSDVVVNRPHVDGFTNGARGPPLNDTSKSENGSCGFCKNVAVNWPVD